MGKKILLDVGLVVLLFLASAYLAGVVSMNRPNCATCGASVGAAFFIGSVLALQPVLWFGGLDRAKRIGIWIRAVVVGAVCYLITEYIGANLLASGNYNAGLNIALYANVVFIAVCAGVSVFLAKSESSTLQKTPKEARTEGEQRD